jgi:hypothetical protein
MVLHFGHSNVLRSPGGLAFGSGTNFVRVRFVSHAGHGTKLWCGLKDAILSRLRSEYDNEAILTTYVETRKLYVILPTYAGRGSWHGAAANQSNSREESTAHRGGNIAAARFAQAAAVLNWKGRGYPRPLLLRSQQ